MAPLQGEAINRVVLWCKGCWIIPNPWMWEQCLGNQCFWVALGSHCRPIMAGLHHKFLWCWLQRCLPAYQITVGTGSFQDLEYWTIWVFSICLWIKKVMQNQACSDYERSSWTDISALKSVPCAWDTINKTTLEDYCAFFFLHNERLHYP